MEIRVVVGWVWVGECVGEDCCNSRILCEQNEAGGLEGGGGLLITESLKRTEELQVMQKTIQSAYIVYTSIQVL